MIGRLVAVSGLSNKRPPALTTLSLPITHVIVGRCSRLGSGKF